MWDYRRLNALSQMDVYPMPRVDDLIDRLGKATTLDFSRGYWQVPVREQDQTKTAFTTPFGFFKFRVMPFGLQGAPATFQRMMDVILQEIGSFAAAYLDDVIIHSNTWQEHLKHISTVLGPSSKQWPHSETKEISIYDVDMQLPRAYRWKWLGPTRTS